MREITQLYLHCLISNIIPKNIILYQNLPNPFNPETVISYVTTKSGVVSLKIFNSLGVEVKSLVHENQNAGSYTVKFNGGGFASGVYFYKLESGDFSETKRMVLLK